MQEKIELFLDDALTYKEFIEVLAQLDDCSDWREAYEKEKHFRRLVKQGTIKKCCSEKVKQNVINNVLAAIERER